MTLPMIRLVMFWLKHVTSVVGAMVVILTLWDAFETIVLPRSVTRQQFSRRYYRAVGTVWSAVICKLSRSGSVREALLVAFAPMSILVLISVWATMMIVGFGMVQWGLGAGFNVPPGERTIGISLYNSGVTFFTLGYGDIVPISGLARLIAVIEAGIGFGFLALVISYLPVLYQAFSRREVTIALVNSRAGSPPNAGTILRRYGQEENQALLNDVLREGERWAAELREAYTSYPILAFYRCQREEDSWLASLTAVLDAAALVESCFADGPTWQRSLAHQARLTGEMGQVTLAGLSRGLAAPKADAQTAHRLSPEKWLRLHADLVSHGVPLPAPDDPRAWSRFQVARARYEPYVVGLAARIRIDLGTWWIPGRHDDGDTIGATEFEESTQDMYLAVLNANAGPGETPRH